MSCADCGKSIADRHPNAYLCVLCAQRRANVNALARMRVIRQDPERLAALRRRQAAWAKAKWAAKRQGRPLMGTCAICPQTFVMNQLGRPRQFCDECGRLNDDYRRTANNKRWYRRHAEEQAARSREYRKRKAAA